MSYFFYALKIKFNMNEKRLVDLKINEVSVIKKQIKNLGFIEGEEIKLLNYNYNKECYLVKVMNINYAVDKKICEEIIVCGK